ncbi:hypothetical protein [Blastomonas sp.]
MMLQKAFAAFWSIGQPVRFDAFDNTANSVPESRVSQGRYQRVIAA